MMMGMSVGPPHSGDDAAAVTIRMAAVIRPGIFFVSLRCTRLYFTLLAVDKDISCFAWSIREECVGFRLRKKCQ